MRLRNPRQSSSFLSCGLSGIPNRSLRMPNLELRRPLKMAVADA
jgi:hypothetical protein